MKIAMNAIIADLSEKCDRRTKALIKAVDALEEIMRLISLNKKKIDDKHRLYFTICDEALDFIEAIAERE